MRISFDEIACRSSVAFRANSGAEKSPPPGGRLEVRGAVGFRRTELSSLVLQTLAMSSSILDNLILRRYRFRKASLGATLEVEASGLDEREAIREVATFFAEPRG
jgi:hypothetical protein